MNFTPEKLKTARDNGYTDDEIWSFLGKDDQRFNLAKENGYTLDDTINTFSKISPPEEEPSGVLRQAADIPVQFAKGIGTGIRGFTDIIGADNPVSKSIAGYEDYMDSLLSAESKNDSKRVAQLLQEAQDKGILDKISAGFEAFASAPIETTANVAGYMVPQLALGLVGKAAQLGKAAQVGLTLGTGFAQGAGTAKGNIYQNTKDFLREQGVAEDKIEDIAVEAQSYNGKNLDQILIGGGLNALAASTGAEAILTRVLAKEGKEVSGGIIGGILKGAGAEAPIEGVQSAQEEVAKNIALQRLGYDVPTFKGAIESATTGVVAGGFVGGLAGGVEALSPEQKEQIDIEKEASRRARDLESTDPATQAISTELTRLERGIDNKRQDLDALESTSPEASKMRLDIAADQSKLAVLKEQANKLGLSETITEAEKQQIELAKAITEPAPEVVAPAAPATAASTAQEGAKGMNLQEVSESAIAAFPDMIEAEGGLLPLTRFTPDEQASLRKAGIVETATTSTGKTYEGVNAEYLWQRRKQLQDERAKKVQESTAPVAAPAAKAPTEPPVSMVGKEVIPGVTPVPVVAKAPTEPTVKESLTVAPVEEEPFGKLPTAEVETGISQRAKEAAIAEEREKIEAPIRRQESINQFLSEGATVKSRTNVVGRKKAAEGGGDITKTAYYLAHPDGKREIPLSKKEASDLKAPAITPAPTPTEPVTTEDIIGKKVTDSMGALPQKAGKARQALQGYIPVFKIGDFYEFIGEDAALSGSTIVGSGKSARSSLPYHQTSKFQEIANKTGKPIAIISNTKVSEVINPITPTPIESAPQRLIRSATESGLKPIKPREGGALRGFYTFQAKDSGSKIAFSSGATIAEENPNELNIEAIYTPPKERGTGSASRLLNEILSIADKNNITLKLEPKGISDLAEEGDSFLTKKQLSSWYKRYGFKQEIEGSDDILVRTPVAPAPIAETPAVAPAPEVAPAKLIAPKEVLDEIKQYPDFYNRVSSNQTLDVGDVSRYLSFRRLPKTIEAKIKKEFSRGGKVSEIESLVSELSQSNKEKAKFEASVKEALARKGESEKLDEAINEYDSAKYNLDDARAKRDNPLIGVKWERESLSRKVGDAQRRLQDVKKKLVDIASRTKPTPAVSETITPAQPEGKAESKRYNPLGYDIADVVEDVKAGKTDTPLRAINQVVEQANQFRDRVKAESQRRQQPRKRGKAAILERVARERSAGNITEKTAQALTDFVNRIREDAIGDTAISIREKGVSNFDFADNLVTFFLNQDKGNLGREVAVHEFWHGLSRFLPEAEVDQINKDYVRELGAYLKKNPWFLAFVGRYTLTPEQYEAYKFFNPKEAQTKLTPVLDERGNITKYKINFDKDNYRYIMLDEFIAEKMTDLILGKQAIPNTFLGKLAKVFREFLALIKSKLGIDPYEKFYQLVTDTNERLTLQRESGLAPPIQIYEPQEYDYSTRRMMAVEPTGERQQIMGEKIGPLKKTPEGIIAETQSKLRERFDPTKITEQNTTEAFRALGRLTGKDGAAFAQELNDIGRMVDESGAAAEVSMGAALFVNDLFEYAVRLAAQGDKKMLGIMMTNINKFPTGTEGRSDAGRALRAAREMKDTFLTMAKAEQDAFINYAAEFVYGPNPTKQQVDSIQIGYDAVEKVQEPTAKEVEEEIAAVGEKTGTDLVGRINDEFTKATEKGKAKRKTEIEELDSEYKKIQEQADKEIEKLAKIQSDTPSFDPTAARQTANDVRAIVANDLKQRPDMGRKVPWKSMLVAKLQEAGVEAAAAETLADIVWRQHEINNLSRELSSINKAVEKGPISEIIKAIKETPLEQQQNPNWRYEVMRDYLRKAGLSVAQAERIAKLMDISLQKRFTQAKEQAFTDAISKTAPWKAGDVRSKRAFQQVIQAIRAGALDPSRNMASDIAAMNGWTGFTADQYKNLLKFDAILANEDSKDIQKAEAYKAIQDIISKSKLPIRARDVIGQYYDAQALSGIPTLSVNSFSPIAFAMRNAIVQAGSGTIKGDAKAIGRAVTEFVDSIKSWANTVAFSFKNNVTVYSNVDYIVNDDNLLRLYRKGVDQFTKSKNAKERADGVKNMMIGMMDYVRRILNALDYGAIAALQNQNISKYAMAVMKRQKMNDKQANEMFGVMMKAKNDFYLQQIAIGTDKNKAGILADEFYISSWKEALSKAGVEKSDIQQAMDAAINDALSSVGRNRQSLDAFKEENTKMKDAGVSSMPALWLLESMANAANQSESQVLKLFSRVIYGFAIVPARVIRETAWFSPYGFVRFGYDWTAKKMGKTSPYAQSLGTDVQYSQRLAEATAGTVALLGLMALRSGSTDDPEDEDEFKIVFTGNGPQRKDDPQFYDSWYKAGNKPNSMIVSFGKTKFTLNMMRGFEAFTWPAMMLGALDDLEIRKKQKQQTKTPAQLEDAAIVAGFVFDAALRRGPYAFTTKSLFGTYGDIGVEGVAKGLTFPAKTLIPVLGTSLASNLSNFLNDPIDRRTLDGAVWSNIPFIGPAVAPKSLNAFGEPSLSTDLASKMFKLGVPIVYDIPTDRESIKLHELVLKQGGGPSIPTRNQLAQRLYRQPTNKEYEMFVREYGTILTKSMKKNYDKLFNAKPEFYSRAIERIGLRARDVAENKVRQAAKKP